MTKYVCVCNGPHSSVTIIVEDLETVYNQQFHQHCRTAVKISADERETVLITLPCYPYIQVLRSLADGVR